MKIFNKKDFEIYCLIWAAEKDFDTTANDLIAIASASHVGTTRFMAIYNEFELMTETARKAALLFNAGQLFGDEGERNSFFDDMTADFFPESRCAETGHRILSVLEKEFE